MSKVTTFREKSNLYALVIPVINEGPRLRKVLEQLVELESGESVDIFVADGGSSDESRFNHYFDGFGLTGLIRYVGNAGLSGQLQDAYRLIVQMGYRGIITMDGNGKDDPKDINRVLAKLEQGFDFVQASRFIQGGAHVNTPLSRYLAIRLLHAPVLSIASGFRWTDTTQGFRGYSAKMLQDARLNLLGRKFQNYDLLAYVSAKSPRLGFSICEVPNSRNYPDGDVPTKISGLGGLISVLKSLFKAAFGWFGR